MIRIETEIGCGRGWQGEKKGLNELEDSVQLLSWSATPWTATLQASLSVTSSRSLLKLMSIKSVMPSNHLILCRPLHLLPSVFPTGSFPVSQFFASGGQSSEYSGLIFFRMDWFDLLGVQGTLKRLLQHHNSKASVFQHLAFLMVQLSTSIHDYWKYQNFDQADPCRQSNVSAF